jgi:hypothetical protein
MFFDYARMRTSGGARGLLPPQRPVFGLKEYHANRLGFTGRNRFDSVRASWFPSRQQAQEPKTTPVHFLHLKTDRSQALEPPARLGPIRPVTGLALSLDNSQLFRRWHG